MNTPNKSEPKKVIPPGITANVLSTRDKINATAKPLELEEGEPVLPTALNKLVKDLTSEEIDLCVKYVAQLRNYQLNGLTSQVNFLVTKAEKSALESVASQAGMSVSKLVRGYLKSVHPQSVLLLALTKKKMAAQQKLIAELINHDCPDIQKLHESLKLLEKLTMVAIALLEERI